jgi:hypothetical protein
MQASQQATPFTTLVRPAYVDNRVCEERERERFKSKKITRFSM